MMENADRVMAQVNPSMPRTWGDSFVHVDDIDYLVLHQEPLVQMPTADNDDEVVRRIGHYVSQLVDDGTTLQIGFGRIPNAVLKYLNQKSDLGIHTQVITDGLLPLFEKKVPSRPNILLRWERTGDYNGF
jgi:acyl-CoA hydrolase